MSKEKNIEEYLSSVKHELRNELMVAHEGISQILDGLGNKNCAKCCEILNPALKGLDELNKLIDELLSISAFESILRD